MVPAVFPQVPLFASVVDLGGEDRTVGDLLVEFDLESVVGLLGQPDHLGIGHLVALLIRVSRDVCGAVLCRCREGAVDPACIAVSIAASRISETTSALMQQYTAPSRNRVWVNCSTGRTALICSFALRNFFPLATWPGDIRAHQCRIHKYRP